VSTTLRKHASGNSIVKVSTHGIAVAAGTTVPSDADVGYAPNCIFIDLDATGGAGWYINRGTKASANFDALIDLAALTATLAELNYLDADAAANVVTRGAGVDGSEGYLGSITRNGALIVTQIYANIDDLVGSATDLDIIGESGVAGCHWGQITTAKSGTIIGGQVTCLEVPTGGTADIDFYSSDVATGTQDVIITDAALGTETALVTSGGAWVLSAPTKAMSGLPTANDYIYIVNGAASGGTFTAGKFLIELFGV
jgi:hypothetical protein